MGKPGSGKRQRGGGQGKGGRDRTPYAHDYNKGSGRGGYSQQILRQIVEREEKRMEEESREELLDELTSRLGPRFHHRGATDHPPSPYRLAGQGRGKKKGSAVPKKSTRPVAPVLFEDDSSGEDTDTADEIEMLKQKLLGVEAERDYFKKQILDKAKGGEDLTLATIKQLVLGSVKAGSAASTPKKKKKVAKAEMTGIFPQVDLFADDSYHDTAGTAALVVLLRNKLQEADKVKPLSLGVDVPKDVHNSCLKLGKAMAKWHFTTTDESTALAQMKQEFFPTDSAKVPNTICPLILRALASRNTRVEFEEIGVTSDGRPTPLLTEAS